MGKSEKERSVEILLKEIKQLTSDCIDRSMDIISKRHPNERYKFDSISFDERKVTVYFIEDSPGDFKEFRHVYLEVSDIATSLQDWDIKINSQSPTEPEFDTLQEGDFFIGTEEDYGKALELLEECWPISHWVVLCISAKSCMFHSGSLLPGNNLIMKTQLAPEEFLRRAENTFKTK